MSCFRLAVFAALVCALHAQPFRAAAELAAHAEPGSLWTLDVQREASRVRATLAGRPGVIIEVNAGFTGRNGAYPGITLSLNGKRLEAPFYGPRASFLSPESDAGALRSVAVEARGQALTVRFENGSYKRLREDGPDEPVPFTATFTVNPERRLEAAVDGLYYMLPTTRDTELEIETQGVVKRRRITPLTEARVEYFKAVRRIAVRDSTYGPFTFTGAIELLQLQIHGPQSGDVFELDLDHAYREAGQKSIPGKIVFETPIN